MLIQAYNRYCIIKHNLHCLYATYIGINRRVTSTFSFILFLAMESRTLLWSASLTILLVSMMTCSSGQQCNPANNSHGPIIPNTDLPAQGDRVIVCMSIMQRLYNLTCRSQAVFSRGFRTYTRLPDAACQSN